jgi:anti-anti-sigma regulatory factor
MTINKDKISGVFNIAGTLDIEAASSFRQALVDLVLEQSPIEADLSAVEACDAAALQVLLAGQRDKTLRVAAASPAVTEIAAALGLSLNGQPDAI